MFQNTLDLRRAFALVLALIGFVSTVSADDPDKPPIELPFYVKETGKTYSFDVQIVEQLTYSVTLRFYLTLPNKWSHFFDKELPEEESRIGELLGGARLIDGNWVELGVPTKFGIKIFQKYDGSVMLDEYISRPKTAAMYMGRYAVLTSKSLSPGIYSIQIDYLEGAPELAPLRAKLLFARSHHGK